MPGTNSKPVASDAVPQAPSTTDLSRRERRRQRRRAEREQGSGVWYPRWYWPSFATPGTIWLAVLFILPFYVVLSIAFGTVGPVFREPLPVYQPWWWSFSQFGGVLRTIVGPDAFRQNAYVRTFEYVAIASLLCLVLGYTIAYFVARYGGRRKSLFLVLLIAPFWISYLMRMYAWNSLLQEDGFVNDFLRIVHIAPQPINWIGGKPITVVLGLVYGYIPYMILPLYAALDRIQQSMLEAGRDLGASPAQTFARVTLPMSKPAILAGIVIVTLPMFGDYYTNDLLSNSPKTSMIGNLIDASLGSPGQGPLAASLVLTLVIILMVPMLYYLRATKRAAEEAA
jgi:spermidine/putrescine transport system permease protein